VTRRELSAALAALGIPSLKAATLPRKAPDLTIGMEGPGRPVRISEYRGKVLVVGFILTT
jgi:hypothetical protein